MALLYDAPDDDIPGRSTSVCTVLQQRLSPVHMHGTGESQRGEPGGCMAAPVRQRGRWGQIETASRDRVRISKAKRLFKKGYMRTGALHSSRRGPVRPTCVPFDRRPVRATRRSCAQKAVHKKHRKRRCRRISCTASRRSCVARKWGRPRR